jgi:hypothetical protein
MSRMCCGHEHRSPPPCLPGVSRWRRRPCIRGVPRWRREGCEQAAGCCDEATGFGQQPSRRGCDEATGFGKQRCRQGCKQRCRPGSETTRWSCSRRGHLSLGIDVLGQTLPKVYGENCFNVHEFALGGRRALRRGWQRDPLRIHDPSSSASPTARNQTLANICSKGANLCLQDCRISRADGLCNIG